MSTLTKENLSQLQEDINKQDIEQVINSIDFTEFKDLVKKWVKIDDAIIGLKNEINGIKTKIKELETHKSSTSPSIMKFMEENNIDELKMAGGTLRYISQERNKPLKQTEIKDKIGEFLQGKNGDASELYDFVYKNRDKINTSVLKRTKL